MINKNIPFDKRLELIIILSKLSYDINKELVNNTKLSDIARNCGNFRGYVDLKKLTKQDFIRANHLYFEWINEYKKNKLNLLNYMSQYIKIDRLKELLQTYE